MRSSVYELIGAIYGDGHIHSTENRVTLVGSLEDYYYYTFYLKPLIEKLFPGINVYIRKRNDRNSYYLSFESKDAFQKLQSFHLWRGAKNNLVLPILSNSLSLKLFLRGLFDTDSFLHTWIKTVGLSNPVHYSKYLYWKRFGYFIPRSSLAFRMNALHLKTEDLF